MSAGSSGSSSSFGPAAQKGCAAICACARKLRAINHATGNHFLPGREREAAGGGFPVWEVGVAGDCHRSLIAAAARQISEKR